jgi:antitoxin (DNA-binding transcriptional repressor) of toxin-antitoxin stability system
MAVVTRVITELRAGEMITTTQAGRASADLEALFPCP